MERKKGLVGKKQINVNPKLVSKFETSFISSSLWCGHSMTTLVSPSARAKCMPGSWMPVGIFWLVSIQPDDSKNRLFVNP